MKEPQTSSGIALAVVVLSIIAMLVVPLPPALLDALLALDVMGAAAVLVLSLMVPDPLDLAAFPTLLLVATLFRLSLDVSATRLILTQGDQPGGAGTVIPAFGDFVMRGNVVVGLLLFCILIVVQLVVVTNGAQRVAEVAARFTLDAMPGKQMAIDADLHAGIVDASAARVRRRAIQMEADFYGAMDGAGKFVRGDAIAALIIVLINIVAGIGIGVLAKHLDLSAAAQTYTLLSIGNALATTLPAFLLSTAMGVMVTRASSGDSVSDDLARQILRYPAALRLVGATMLALALVPGLPHMAFGALGAAGVVAGAAAGRAREKRRREELAADSRRRRVEAGKPESAVALLGVEQLGIDVGEALLPLLDEPAGSALLQRIGNLRRALALELGIVLPGVHVRDDLRLPPRGFAIRVRDRVVAHGQMYPDRALALASPAALSQLPGEATLDPVTGAASRWLPRNEVRQEEAAPHATIVDPIAVLTSKLGAVARAHAPALLGRQEVQLLLDHVRRMHPAAVKGVVPELAGLGLVQRVLQHLVREGVSIRDLVVVLETLADEAEHGKDASSIGEAARRRLAPAICASLAGPADVIAVAAFTAEAESNLSDSIVQTDRGPLLGLDAAHARKFHDSMQRCVELWNGRAVFVCTQPLRLPLARFVESAALDASILGLAEVAPGYTIEVKETIAIEPR